MKLGQGRIGRGPKGRKRAEWKRRTDEGGVVSFRN